MSGARTYVTMIVLLMFVLPAGCIALDRVYGVTTGDLLFVACQWFVFWAVGIRLLLAGVRQMLQPRYTAQTILGLHSPDATFLVRELGFGNTALGCIGIASLANPAWVWPAAVAGVVFFGLAGINHWRHAERTSLQTVAMVSDLGVALILAALGVLVRFPALRWF